MNSIPVRMYKLDIVLPVKFFLLTVDCFDGKQKSNKINNTL